MGVEYASYLWEDFGTSISHLNLTNGVSSAQFWILILKEVYSQENIFVPTDVETAEFSIMVARRVFVDDLNAFLIVARIPDSMLKLVDPKKSIFWFNT